VEFIIQNRDGSFLNQVLDPANVAPRLVHGEEVFNHMARVQKQIDAAAQNKRGVGMVAGGTGNVKVIAMFPEAVMIRLMHLEPDLLRDKKTFWGILKRYPAYRAYTRLPGRIKGNA
jgi:hypothetical protein